MKIDSFESFCNYYQRWRKTPGMMSVPKNELNEKQLLTKYEKYCKVQAKKLEKKPKGLKQSTKGNQLDELWIEMVELVKIRDNCECQFLKLSSEDDRKWFYKTYPYNLIQTLDIAHVIPRSKSTKLYYDLDNLRVLNRVSHGFLDTYKHPLYGTPISREDRDNWWKKIIGEDTYNSLEENK